MPSPATILVIDDERAIREIVAELLEEEGYTVQSASDGLEALAVIETTRVDLILSDVKMPRLDGDALVRRLRASGSAIPVVLMSAVVTEVALPGVRLVRKPFDTDDLLAIVASVLQPCYRERTSSGVTDRKGQVKPDG